MKLGEKIRKSRKSSGITGSVLASQVGCCGSLISKIETSQHKGQPDPDIVSKIADALNDKSILTTYLENNPVYQSIVPTMFSDVITDADRGLIHSQQQNKYRAESCVDSFIDETDEGPM